MKSKINIFKYNSYRRFLTDWLKEKNFSYRTFVMRYEGVVSFIALAKMLSKGRAGRKETNDYRMSPESLARLGKNIRLSDGELRHLILLRLENDAEVLKGKFGNAYQQILKELVENSKKQETTNQSIVTVKTVNQLSPTGRLVLEIFELLSFKFREKVIEEIVLQAKIYASRQTDKAGVKTLQALLRDLNQMKDSGAP